MSIAPSSFADGGSNVCSNSTSPLGTGRGRSGEGFATTDLDDVESRAELKARMEACRTAVSEVAEQALTDLLAAKAISSLPAGTSEDIVAAVNYSFDTLSRGSREAINNLAEAAELASRLKIKEMKAGLEKRLATTRKAADVKVVNHVAQAEESSRRKLDEVVRSCDKRVQETVRKMSEGEMGEMLEEATARAVELGEELSAAHTELESTRRELREKGESMEELESEHKVYKQRVMALEQEVVTFNQKSAGFRNELERAQADIGRLDEENHALSARNRLLMSDGAGTLQRMEIQIEELRADCDGLRAEKAQLDEALGEVEHVKSVAMEARTLAEIQVHELTVEVGRLNGQVSIMREEVEEASAEALRLAALGRAAWETALIAEVASLEYDYSHDMTELMEASSCAKANAAAELAALSEAHQQAVEEREASFASELEARIREAQAELQQANAELAHRFEELDTRTSAQLAEQQATIEVRDAAIAHKDATLAEQAEFSTKGADELASAQQRVVALEGELEQAAAYADAERQAVAFKLGLLEADLEGARATSEEWRLKLEAELSNPRLVELQQQADDANDKVSKAVDEVAAVRADLEAMRDENGRLNGQVSTLEGEARELHKTTLRVPALEAELDQARAAIIDARAEAEALKVKAAQTLKNAHENALPVSGESADLVRKIEETREEQTKQMAVALPVSAESADLVRKIEEQAKQMVVMERALDKAHSGLEQMAKSKKDARNKLVRSALDALDALRHHMKATQASAVMSADPGLSNTGSFKRGVKDSPRGAVPKPAAHQMLYHEPKPTSPSQPRSVRSRLQHDDSPVAVEVPFPSPSKDLLLPSVPTNKMPRPPPKKADASPSERKAPSHRLVAEGLLVDVAARASAFANAPRATDQSCAGGSKAHSSPRIATGEDAVPDVDQNFAFQAPPTPSTLPRLVKEQADRARAQSERIAQRAKAVAETTQSPALTRPRFEPSPVMERCEPPEPLPKDDPEGIINVAERTVRKLSQL